MPNRFTPIKTNTPDDQRIAIINKNFGELDNENVNKIYRGPDGVPRILIDGSTGVIKVAPVGTDVTSADDGDLLFNSAQRTLKVAASGTLTMEPLVGQGNFETITHNLGFVPMVIATCKSPTMPVDNRAMLPYWNGEVGVSKVHAQIGNVRSDIVQMEVTLGSSAAASAGTWDFTYYLLQESAI